MGVGVRRIVGTAVACLAVATVLSPTSADAQLYWGPNGLRDVRGAIEAEWLRIGRPSWAPWTLGDPLTHEMRTPRRVGAFNHFERGSIYWSPATGAHEVRGGIRDRWAATGWEGGPLGFPVTNELWTPDGHSKFNHFEGGSIYWSPATGAQEVRGAIRGRWAALGWETGELRLPVTGELGTPNGRGRFNHFQGGSIYWSPSTGAHELHGEIRDRWAALGWETSALGFPVTGERVTPDGYGLYNHFQNGSIYWTPETGAHEVRGAIHAAWASMGWENSPLGYPVSDEYAVPGGRRSDFEFGSLEWTPDNGVAADVVVSGSGDAVIPIPTGMSAAAVSFDATGESVVATVKPAWVTPNDLVSGSDAWSGVTLVNREGQAATGLKITSNGDWTVELAPISALPTIGVLGESVTGSGHQLRRYTGPADGRLRVEATTPSTTVRLYTSRGVQVTTISTSGVPAWSYLNSGHLLEVVQSDVPWTISVVP